MADINLTVSTEQANNNNELKVLNHIQTSK